MSPDKDIISWFPANHSLLFLLNAACCVLSWEATNTNFIVFELIRSEIEPTIYHTRGEHANQYITDVVNFLLKISLFFLLCITFVLSNSTWNKHLIQLMSHFNLDIPVNNKSIIIECHSCDWTIRLVCLPCIWLFV